MSVMRAAPAEKPQPAIKRICSEVTAKLAMPDVRVWMVKQGPEAHALTPEQVNALIEADIARLAGFVEHANIKMAR